MSDLIPLSLKFSKKNKQKNPQQKRSVLKQLDAHWELHCGEVRNLCNI